jgi:hypothetical protein
VDLIKAGYAQWCNGNRIGQFNIVSPNVMGRLLSQCYSKSYLSKRCIVGENSKGEILYSNKRVYVYRLNSHVDAINAFCEAEKLCPISLLKNTDEEQITSNDFSVYFEYDEDVCHDQKWEEKRGNRLLEMLETCAD